MFGIGIEELVVIFIIALFVFGPERLPSIARDVGKAMRELRRASDELTEEFLRADQSPAASPAAIESPSAPTESAAPSATSETPQPPAPATVADDVTEFDRKAQE